MVDPMKYRRRQYVYKERFISFWHQIDEILRLEPVHLLEIGVGNKLVSSYLKDVGVNVTTLDIDLRLDPLVVGTVDKLPFINESFDAVACFQVLEHISFEQLPLTLAEFHRIARKDVVISLPDVERAYPFHIHVPRLGEFKRIITIPRLRKLNHQFDGEHFWEIGKRQYPLSLIQKQMEDAGFRIANTYRVFENLYHRFFLLEKL
jgi:ubiquinone/menaquinone biosynthesis C-methylase UbiE